MQKAKLVASDGDTYDNLGYSVAISGDTVVAGAYRNDHNGSSSGAAYIFEKPGIGWAGTFYESAKLIASDGASNDYLGNSVAISGDTVVAGAFTDDNNGSNSGSAYVFVKPGGGWTGTLTETAKLIASDGAEGDWFAYSVAISGDTVVAGANRNDDNGSASGSAYVFIKPGGGWTGTLTETAKLIASDGVIYDYLGQSVAVDGDTVVVGAYGDDDKGPASGSTYVFLKPGAGWTGTLTETAKLIASDGAQDDTLGRSVAISGDTVVAGADRDDDNGYNSGSAYIFVIPGGGWTGTLTETAKLIASDGAKDDYFGQSVAISSDNVVVGSPYDDDYGDYSGSAYVFVKPGGGWSGTLTETVKLIASDGAQDDRFSYSVAISGDTVVAGAYNDDDIANNSGSVYVFADVNKPISIDDINILEGDSATTDFLFTVTRADSSGASSVDWFTSDGSATVADNDYYSATGTLNFADGEITKTVTITVNGDTLVEAYEVFYVTIHNPTNAEIGDGQGMGTIIDDDSTSIRVTHSDIEADQPDVGIDGNGNVHIAYMEARDWDDSCYSEIGYSMLDNTGSTLIDDTRLTVNDGDPSVRPAVVVDTNDIVHIVYMSKDCFSGTPEGLYYTKLDPSLDDQNGDAAISSTVVLSDNIQITDINSGSGPPRLAIDGDDNIHVVWEDTGWDGTWEHLYYMKIDDSGNELVSETIIYTTEIWRSNIDIALDSNGDPHIVFQDYDNEEIYYMMLDGSNGSTLISATLVTTDDGEASNRPAIAVDEWDMVHITWKDHRGTTPEIYYTKLDPFLDDRDGDPADLSAITLIDKMALTPDDGVNSIRPAMSAHGSTLHITWIDDYENSDFHGYLYYLVLNTDGSVLLDPTKLTPGKTATSSTAGDKKSWTNAYLDVDEYGTAHIVWGDDRVGTTEVYYHRIALLDFGDAPEVSTSYPTTLANDGARHPAFTNVYLGALIDREDDGQPDANAAGDDLTDSDDEDGIVLGTLAQCMQYAVVTATASTTGLLDAWVDFNSDGDWAEASEQIFASEPLTTGANLLTFEVPCDAVVTGHAQTFARFRFSTAGGLSYDGLAYDGEVEDYAVEILESFQAVFYSIGREDGQVLERNEDSDDGGAINSKGKLMRVGDDASDKQYRSFLSFKTASLPNDAIVVSGELVVREYNIEGNPYATLGTLWVDMRTRRFGRYPWVEANDFNAKANLPEAFYLSAMAKGNWLFGDLPQESFEYVNLRGRTQFRLRFDLDDDDDGVNDYVNFITGNAKQQQFWPALTLYYYLP